MKLEIIDCPKDFPATATFLRDFIGFMEKALKRKKILPSSTNKKLTLAFVSPAKMKSLNKGFLKKNYVTDVLSFAPVERNSFGELALCAEQISSQAEKKGLSLKEETAYLILHGFLHLLGYHHESGGAPAKKMFSLQDEIFSQWQKALKTKKGLRKKIKKLRKK